MENLINFDEFIISNGLLTGDSPREVKKFTRFLTSNLLKRKEEFILLTKASISMATILLAAEKFELDMNMILDYLTRVFNNKRINKLSKLRGTKAYIHLNQVAKSYYSFASSP